MISREELRGEWNQVKGRLQEHWGQLTDEDLRRSEGQAERLVGIIQEKTGASKREIEQFLDRAVHDASSVAQHMSQAARHYADEARHYADEAGDAIRAGMHQASESASDLTKRCSDVVSRRPMESLAVAFTVGIAAGLLLMFNRRG